MIRSMIHPCAEIYAKQWERGLPWRPSKAYKAAIQERVVALAGAIPVPLIRVPIEPCPDLECLIRHAEQGVLPMRQRERKGHPVMGSLMTEFRAVHDWYGHILPRNPFGLAGELAAYRVHERENFDAWLLPYVWHNVVLENAYREARGKWPHPGRCWWCRAPLRWDVAKFGKPEEALGNV